MRKFITIARVRGEDAWEMVFGPETPYQDQRAEFKEAKNFGVHPRYERLQIVEVANSGDMVRLNAPPVPTPPPAPPTPVPDSVVVPPGTVVTEVTHDPTPSQASEPPQVSAPTPEPEPEPSTETTQVTEPDDESAEFDTSKARPRRATGSRK